MSVQEIRIDAGSLSVGALDYGPPEGHPDAATVLISHGLGDSAWCLQPLALSLTDRYRVVSLDLRGHGRSDWGAYTLAHFVGDLVGVCETLELDKPILIGHSLGGQAVAQLCGLYPDLPRAGVLIEALGPPSHPRKHIDPAGLEREWSRMRVELVRRPARSKPQPDLASAIERFREVNPLIDADRAAFIVDKNTMETAEGGRLWRHDPSNRDWLAGHDHERAEQRWQGATCPIQVVLGVDAYETFWSRSIMRADDPTGPMPPEETARRMANFADARLDEIEGAGHMVHYDRPDELNRIVAKFLAEVAPV